MASSSPPSAVPTPSGSSELEQTTSGRLSRPQFTFPAVPFSSAGVDLAEDQNPLPALLDAEQFGPAIKVVVDRNWTTEFEVSPCDALSEFLGNSYRPDRCLKLGLPDLKAPPLSPVVSLMPRCCRLRFRHTSIGSAWN